ncbi:ferredoxin [Phenylobacterium sp.]|uniref:ferredoxin n=1 Tax=Phenylobacterium sp. TaxID=1871053 RepID=UPI002F3F12AA
MKLTVTDREGAVHELPAQADDVLMVLIRDRVDNAVGVCGGVISCGTCLVQFEPEEAARLQPAFPDELEMLEALDARPGERLGCQVRMVPALDGLALTVAPEA